MEVALLSGTPTQTSVSLIRFLHSGTVMMAGFHAWKSSREMPFALVIKSQSCRLLTRHQRLQFGATPGWRGTAVGKTSGGGGAVRLAGVPGTATQ